MSGTDTKAGGDTYKAHKCMLRVHQQKFNLTVQCSLGPSGKSPGSQNLHLAPTTGAGLQSPNL